MNNKKISKKQNWLGLSRNVISMGVVSFFNDVSSDMIFPFIPLFLTSTLGATATFVGLMEGIADATASVLKIISGRLSDRLKIRKPLVIFGYSLSAIAKPVLALAMSPWHVLAVRFMDRVGKGTREAPRDALLSLSTPPKKIGRAFGFHRSADTLGAAIGPLLAFFILPLIHNNLRTLFLLSFIASLSAIIVLIRGVKEIPHKKNKIEAVPFKITFLGLSFSTFLASATIFSLGRASEVFLLLRAQNAGVSMTLLPLLYFVFNIALALSAIPTGILSDKIGHRNTFMIGMVLCSITLFFFSRETSSMGMWLLFALYGFATAFTEGVGRAIVADLVKPEWRGSAYGMYSAFTGIALLPASLVFGILWDLFGPAAPFTYGAILGIIALLFFLFFRVLNHDLHRHLL